VRSTQHRTRTVPRQGNRRRARAGGGLDWCKHGSAPVPMCVPSKHSMGWAVA
jgi:hypothetical protein